MNPKKWASGAFLALLVVTGRTTGQQQSAEVTETESAEVADTVVTVIVNTVGTSGCNPEVAGDYYFNLGQAPGDNEEHNTFNVGHPGCEAGHWADVVKEACEPLPGSKVEAICQLYDENNARWIGYILGADLRTNPAQLEALYTSPHPDKRDVGFAPALWGYPEGESELVPIPQLDECVSV